jgi:hypothetical protein
LIFFASYFKVVVTTLMASNAPADEIDFLRFSMEINGQVCPCYDENLENELQESAASLYASSKI